MRAKRVTAFLLAGVLSVSLLMGCGIDQDATFATADGVEVSMGVVNFYCRYEQAYTEDFYVMYLGDDVWSQDLYGDGTTMEESLKESAVEELHEMYTLQAHMSDYGVELTEDEQAAITEAAETFMSANSEDTLNEMGATQEIVEEVLTLFTIQNKMQDAIEAEADTDVSDEEANMRGYTQVEISTNSYTDDDGNTVEYTDDEIAELGELAEEMVSALSADDATLESVAELYGYETTTETYATYEEEDEDSDEDSDDEEDEDPVMTALEGLAEGETSGVIETDSAYYIVRVDSDTDEEATESNRESIIEERQSDHYNEVLEGWQEDDGWEANESMLKKISFDNSLTQTDPDATESTEETESTETVDSTETVEDTESAK